MLAVVLSIVRAHGLIQAAFTFGLTCIFIFVILFLIQPGLRGITERSQGLEPEHKSMMPGVLMFAFVCALFTETIGIHALFGAFLAGAVLPPQERFRMRTREHLESFTVVLLPLFFAFTGLRTQVGLLEGWPDWLAFAVIVTVAIAGKLGGTSLAAHAAGLSWFKSLRLGTLMNTRGLIELIALNIGYDLGILSTRLFVMMVLMALVTTIMTGPILSFMDFYERHWVLQSSRNKEVMGLLESIPDE